MQVPAKSMIFGALLGPRWKARSVFDQVDRLSRPRRKGKCALKECQGCPTASCTCLRLLILEHRLPRRDLVLRHPAFLRSAALLTVQRWGGSGPNGIRRGTFGRWRPSAVLRFSASLSQSSCLATARPSATSQNGFRCIAVPLHQCEPLP
jgi:hypothetical protein